MKLNSAIGETIQDHRGSLGTIQDYGTIHNQPYQNIWDHTGSYRTIEDHREAYGTILGYTGPYEP